MNESLFNRIAKEDLDNFNSLINKGYFDTSTFEEAIISLSNSLDILYKEITSKEV